MVMVSRRLLATGNEAVARGAVAAHVDLATGYPGTPATDILERLPGLAGRAQWAPNEKVALEVGLGVAYGQGRALVVMKHVGLNVAADPFFSAAYTEIAGGLVVVSADDPGMSSSQNEQDNRHYALAAGVPMFEPADAQQAFEFTLAAFELSERWQVPVLLRLTTRVCHAKSVLRLAPGNLAPREPCFERDVPGRVLLPGYGRACHRRLRGKLAEIAAWNDESSLHQVRGGKRKLGIVCSGVAALHAREAASEATVLHLAMTHPLPAARIRRFVASVDRCVVVEEGGPFLADRINAAGIAVESMGDDYRFGELNVNRVRQSLFPSDAPAPPAPVGDTADSAPQLCPPCPHREVLALLRDMNLIVAGDIGCYTLGALPPYEAIDTTICMGASIGVGLGLRHVLPEDQARRVVSIIGDSTFVHSGIGPLTDMTYNPPPTGHVVIILDNGTTAMTGMQDHPGTGVTLNRERSQSVDFEALARSVGVRYVETHDVVENREAFRGSLERFLSGNEPALLIARRPCALQVQCRAARGAR
jgi:indolepyruvate ferredoxin oxidoreductase alpha subunit